MGLRINHNIQAINSHRQLLINDRAMGKSLEKLSSGLRINRAADGPAMLMISEQLRSQVAGLNAAVDNSEIAITMIQTAESSLVEVNNLLTAMRGLAIQAANEGVNDDTMLEAIQLEIDQSLDTIDRITNNAQFGKKKLLDGTTGANGVGIGEGVQFVQAGVRTRTSPVQGYDVRVFQLGARAEIRGTAVLTQEMIDAGEQFTIAEGGRTVTFTTTAGDSVSQVFGKLNSEMEKNGLDIVFEQDEDGAFMLRHNKFGSEFAVSASSSTAGVLSPEAREMVQAFGQDIRGNIGGELATGVGQVLTGTEGTRVEDLAVRYTGEKTVDPDDEEEIVGKVAVFQNSLIFQVGPNVGQTESISLLNTNTRVLGRGVVNESGFRFLRDADIRTPQGATDTQRLVERVLDEVNTTRGVMGAFQKNTLESNLRQLRISVEELTNAESVIRDADMAIEITEFTRNSIMLQSATAMLAQANQTPQTILALLG
ncbi:MAG: flagellin [SAR324 cluster bacterium]|nr:flagellin [SAR324 cluster bacterium]